MINSVNTVNIHFLFSGNDDESTSIEICFLKPKAYAEPKSVTHWDLHITHHVHVHVLSGMRFCQIFLYEVRQQCHSVVTAPAAARAELPAQEDTFQPTWFKFVFALG